MTALDVLSFDRKSIIHLLQESGFSGAEPGLIEPNTTPKDIRFARRHWANEENVKRFVLTTERYLKKQVLDASAST